MFSVTAQHRLGQTGSGRIRIVVSIPACHAGGRGSIPRCGAHHPFAFSFDCIDLHVLVLGDLSQHNIMTNKAQDVFATACWARFVYLAGPAYFVVGGEITFIG